MKVLHIINNLRREGAQVMVFNLVTVEGAGETRHFLYVREPGGALQAPIEQHGVTVFAPDCYLGLSSSRQSLKLIDDIVRNEEIDIIHAHMADAAFLGQLAAKRRSLPLVITHHGSDILPNCNILCRAVYQFLLAGASRYARCNVVVSSAVAETVHRRLAPGSDRVAIIANGVPVPEEDAIAGARQFDAGAVTILSVGRLVPLKSQEQLISASSALLEDHAGLHVVFVGDGPRKDDLYRQVVAAGLAEAVTFTGEVEDVTPYLHDADIFVSTSRNEGMPMAVLEAMAWGLPIIASDVPGNRDIVEHGETGLLFPFGDVDRLVDAVREVINAPGPAAERARRARETVKRRFSSDAAARAYESVYARVLDRGYRGAGLSLV